MPDPDDIPRFLMPPEQRATLFERMSRIAREGLERRALIDALDAAAIRSRMPPDQQLRFRHALREMAQGAHGKRPLPKPPK